jgi:hypothetical protein
MSEDLKSRFGGHFYQCADDPTAIFWTEVDGEERIGIVFYERIAERSQYRCKRAQHTLACEYPPEYYNWPEQYDELIDNEFYRQAIRDRSDRMEQSETLAPGLTVMQVRGKPLAEVLGHLQMVYPPLISQADVIGALKKFGQEPEIPGKIEPAGGRGR